MPQSLNDRKADLTVTVTWQAGATEARQVFPPEAPLPSVFRCPEPGCTGTGFSLKELILKAVAVRAARWVRYTATVECQGTILRDGAPVRPCGKPFGVTVEGTVAPKVK
jgi:hypothetical protein